MANRIKGIVVEAPIWGGTRPVFLSTWNEIKKLGFKKHDRSFGHVNDENGKFLPALFFYAAEHCCSLSSVQLAECKHEWYVTLETLDEISD